jgi:hypothetical protein
MDEAALDFYYYGFYAALKRFRTVAGVGWLVTGAGAGAFVVRWQVAHFPGWFDIVVCCGCIVAGITVVQTAVAALTAYVRVPFPLPAPTEGPEGDVIVRLKGLMMEVGDGGWREAGEAIRRVRELGEGSGLPSPSRPARLER